MPRHTAAMDRFIQLALECVHREYPNHVQHLMHRNEDAAPPRVLHPAFYGCFDWHSAVHGHWLLATAPERSTHAKAARAALERSLTADHIAAEVAYLRERPGFERPYGLAWLCQLHAELRAHADLRALAKNLEPLVDLAEDHLGTWLEKLSHPLRTGTHDQTAFSLGLVLDWARAHGRTDMAQRVERRSLEFFEQDRDYPLHLEPGGEDFLSPSLGAADLMSRILGAEAFSEWLNRTMPELGRTDPEPLRVVHVTDPEDGRLAHLDGLNLSRAWMLRRIAAHLPTSSARVTPLRALADAHAKAGLTAISEAHYEGAHWLGTFAVYLLRA